MKKSAFKPGFEFIFSLCIMAVLGLPPLVFGQATKDLQITINNGDTTINGKNIRDLSASDRKEALKDINQITVINSDDHQPEGHPPMITNDDMRHERQLRIMKMDKDGKDSTMAFNYNVGDMPRHRMEKRDIRINRGGDRMEFGRRNTQNFEYNNIDNDGISTHVSYHVSDHPAMLDYDAGKQGDTQMDMLNLMDLSIVPQFSEGKTVLMFNLPSKAVAEVQFKDSKGTLIWSGKAINGSFTRSFPLGLNGSYYLQVKQGSKVAVKKIEKE